MADDDFTVELRWGMRPKSLMITKQDMIADTSGKYFFEFDTKKMVGKVTAICRYYVPDTDDPDGVREEVDSSSFALCGDYHTMSDITACPEVQCFRVITSPTSALRKAASPRCISDSVRLSDSLLLAMTICTSTC